MSGLPPGLPGELGLTLLVLTHLAYTAYENRRGAVAKMNARLKAVGTVLYRLSQDHDGVDENAVREEVMANGGDSSVLPSDFDDETYGEAD